MNYTIHVMNYVMQQIPRRSHHLKAGARKARNKRPVSSSITSAALADDGGSQMPTNTDKAPRSHMNTVKGKGVSARPKESRALVPLVVPPFERQVPGMDPASGTVADYTRLSWVAKFSPFKVNCPYCEGLVSMNAKGCTHCGRGLLNYWLWEKAVFKRLLLLSGIAALALIIVGKILFSYYGFQW